MSLVSRFRRTAQPRLELVDVEAFPPEDPAADLLRIAAEAVILQDKAEEVLALVARHESLGLVAPVGGPLTRRFFALRAELPLRCADGHLQWARDTLDTILYHHAMQLSTAMEFLAVEWRSITLARQVESLHGLGAPARMLEELYHDLAARGSGPDPGPSDRWLVSDG